MVGWSPASSWVGRLPVFGIGRLPILGMVAASYWLGRSLRFGVGHTPDLGFVARRTRGTFVANLPFESARVIKFRLGHCVVRNDLVGCVGVRTSWMPRPSNLSLGAGRVVPKCVLFPFA